MAFWMSRRVITILLQLEGQLLYLTLMVVRTHFADGCLDVLEVVSLLLQMEGQLLHLTLVVVRTHLADGCLDVLEIVSLLLQLEGQLLHLSSVVVRVDLQINLEEGLHNSTYMQSWPPVEEYN
jgi:hypothetical protein